MHQETSCDAATPISGIRHGTGAIATASFTTYGKGDRHHARVEAAAEISCSLDAEGRIRDISDNIEALYGWSRDAMIGRLFLDFVHPDDREAAYNSYRLRIAGQAHPAEQRRFFRSDGSSVDMSWSLIWMKIEQVCHCIGRTTDAAGTGTENPIPGRIDAIGRLSGKVAHDFNNLLTVILGCSEALATEIQLPRHHKLAELSLRAARRGRELTQRLLAVGQRQPLAPLAFDPSRLLNTLTPSIANILGPQTQLGILPGSDTRPVFADPAQTETAILNLCLNAREAMPDGGRVTIRAANVTIDDRHTELPAGDYVALTITDTGTGIAPELIDRIFEPFFTTREDSGNSGLGLSMALGFVQQSDGHIIIESRPGNGTTVTLLLPPAEVAAQAHHGTEDGIAGPLVGRENILVVEDDDLVRAHVECKLESLGYAVVAAASGREALAILEERDDIDLLFTDIVMPGGMNGRELGEVATRRWPGLRILYTSGYSGDLLSRDGRLIDGLLLLAKPYTKSELSTKIRQALDTFA